MHQEILTFWFEEAGPAKWWKKDDAFDCLIAARYSDLYSQAIRCELFEWRRSAKGRLAEIIILDQFSRNIYRDKPEAFAADSQALVLAQEAVAIGADKQLAPIERVFLYMPYMHSESSVIHAVAVKLYEDAGLEDNLKFEQRHKAIIDRFGRYPHRNDILARASTAEEIGFLKEPGSSF